MNNNQIYLYAVSIATTSGMVNFCSRVHFHSDHHTLTLFSVDL